MSRKNNGIYNPNAPIAEPRQKEPSTFHDGHKAIIGAVGGLVIATNWLIPAIVDSSDSHGAYIGNKYYSSYPDGPVFECSDEGNVIKKDDDLDDPDSKNKVPVENYGHPEACADGKLTPRDGAFWNSKLDKWGLVGIAFK